MLRMLLAFAALALGLPPAHAEFRVEDVKSLTAAAPGALAKGAISFSDVQGSELVDKTTGLVKFEDWASARPVEKRLLSLYPAYAEPTITVTVNGVSRPYKEKLHVYVAAARFALDKPAPSVDLAKYANVAFLERIDPVIKHRVITPTDATPLKDAQSAHNQHPDRRWCAEPQQSCIRSKYQLEGKFPLGIKLVNTLDEGGKKIADYLEFESELRLLPGPQADAAGLGELTGVGSPIASALEQSIFHVNQMMQFGKFLAVVQADPRNANRAVVTAFIALAIESDVLEMKKDYAQYPVLRNLVPAQVLLGKSSFNTGTSLSAGLPSYARNRLKAIAGILESE